MTCRDGVTPQAAKGLLTMIRARTLLIGVLGYSLLLTSAAVPAHGQEIDDSFAIAYGDTVSDGVPGPGAGNIEVGGAVDAYSFEAESGDVAIFDVLAGATTTFRWRLESPTGALLFDAAYVDRSEALTETGTYVLSVYGLTATSTGTYSFRPLLTPPPQHFTIAFGDTVSDGVPQPGAGNIEVPGAVDTYVIDAIAGQVAIFDALSGPTSGLRWSLETPSGDVLFDLIYADRNVELPETGTYTLKVRGLTVTGVGRYSFRPLLTPQAEEFIIAFGDTVSDGVPQPGAGNIEGPGAVDSYLFHGTAGQAAIFDAITAPTSGLRWNLHAPDRTQLFDAAYTDQEVTLPQTGTYTLEVRGLTVTSFGAYSFQLREAPQNTDPVALDDEAETDYGVAVTVDVLANDSDPDGDELILDAVSQPANGTAVVVGALITYTPDEGSWGVDSFTYTISDGRGGTAQATVTITVREPANTPPTIEDIEDRQNTVGDVVTLQVVATDPDGDVLGYAADGLPPGLGIDPDTGEITGTIEDQADAASPYTVEVTVTDPGEATATVNFHWVVLPATTGPVAVRIDILLPCLLINGFGVIPVVIYGNDEVDAGQIDLATISLEGMFVQRVLFRYLAVVHDFNGDGYDDVLVMIDEVAGSIPSGATTASLTGQLKDGTEIEGVDEICILPPTS
jgi:predicted secreted protein